MTESNVHTKAYKFRLYPTAEQKRFFAQTFGCARAIWNMMLADKISYYKETGKMLSDNTPAKYKEEFPWLKEVDSLALANAQLHLQSAYKSFFDSKTGFPKFKAKKHHQSYSTNNQKGSIRIENGKIKLPKTGWVPIKLHRQIQGDIRTVTISKTADDKYYISIISNVEIQPLPKTNSSIGIDLGLLDYAISSNGDKTGNPKFLRKRSKKLSREQRKLSRRAKLAKASGRLLSESSNYQKQRRKVASIHAKIANQRKDFLHKLSTAIIKNHDTICVESLAVKNLMRNHNLAKSIADASWSEFVRQLTYKAEWYGRSLVKIDQWYASTQLCSNCNQSSGKKNLSIREWTCEHCGVTHDRDINASINIHNEGLRLASL